ncbi:MAG: O-antigen/teichoic acid export membrane protein, partial [Psychromonas sp.]
YFNQSIWYKLSGQTKFGAYIAIGGASLTVLVNYIFIPKYGYVASAWATLVVYAAQTVASFLLSRKYYPIKYNLRKFVLYMGTAVLFYALAKQIDFDSTALDYLSKNAFLVAFIGLVFWMEKPKKISSSI